MWSDQNLLQYIRKTMLRLSTPVRNNDNTDDNKENILAGQDISRTKSEEKGTETVSTPVFNSRDSNKSVHPIDKFNDILNLEEESKNSPPPHPAAEPKSAVRLDVESSEISPENCELSDPFVYHCSNLQQTILKKERSGDVTDEQESGNSLNGLNVTTTVDECGKSEDLIDVQLSGGGLDRSFIESEQDCQRQDISRTFENNTKNQLYTSVEPEDATTASDEIVLDSSKYGEQDIQESNVVSLLPNVDPEKISIGSGEYNSCDQISGGDCDYKSQDFCVDPETASIDNSEVDEEPGNIPTVEPKLNSTLTISTGIPQTLPDSPRKPEEASIVTSGENTFVCPETHTTELTPSNYEYIQPELTEKVQEGDVLVTPAEPQLANCQVSNFVPEPHDSTINLEIATEDKQASDFSKEENEENDALLPSTESIVEKTIPNSEECEIYESKINSELSDSVAELSVYEECTQVDENQKFSLDVIPYDTNPVQTEIDSVGIEKPNISSSYKSVNTTFVSGSEIGETADSELEALLNITTVNSQEENIDKSCVDLVCDISEENSDSPNCVKQPDETSFTVANTTTDEYFDSSQDFAIEEKSDLEHVGKEVPAENKSSSAFIVLSPPKSDVQLEENSNIVNVHSSTQGNNSCSSLTEEDKQVEEKVISNIPVVDVLLNHTHSENALVDTAENLRTEELNEDPGHEKLTAIQTNSISEKYMIDLKEMADINEKLQQENSDLKLELNASKQAKASLELEMGKKDEIILKTQAEALKKEQQLYQDIKTLKEQLKEKSIMNEKNNVKELEEALKEAKAKESHALGELNARMNDELNYRKIMEEYEKTIAARIADSQKLKEENETVTRHLGNLELSFSDLHQKYERTKNIIDGFKTNEERLREKFVVFEETIRKQEEKYESLKAHARAQIEKSNKEIIQHREKYDSEVNKLNAIIKRLEIKSAALETSLEQKTKECIALAALCDEVTGKKV